MKTRKISIRTEDGWDDVALHVAGSAVSDANGRQIDVTYQTKADSGERAATVDRELADRQPSTVVGAGTTVPRAKAGRHWMEVVGDDASSGLTPSGPDTGETVYLGKRYDFGEVPTFGGNTVGGPDRPLYIKEGRLTEVETVDTEHPVRILDDGSTSLEDPHGLFRAGAVRVDSKDAVPVGDAVDDAVTHRELADVYGVGRDTAPVIDWEVQVGDTVSPPEGMEGAVPTVMEDHSCAPILRMYFAPKGAEALVLHSFTTGSVYNGAVVGNVAYGADGHDVRVCDLTYKEKVGDGYETHTVKVTYPTVSNGKPHIGNIQFEWDTGTMTAVSVGSVYVDGSEDDPMDDSAKAVPISEKDLTATGEWNYAPDAVDPLSHMAFHPDFGALMEHMSAAPALAVEDGAVKAVAPGTGVVKWTKDGRSEYRRYDCVCDLDVVVFDGQSNMSNITYSLYSLGHDGDNPPPGVGFVFGYDGFSLDADWAFNLRSTKQDYYHLWGVEPTLNKQPEKTFDQADEGTWPPVFSGTGANGKAAMCDMVGTRPVRMVSSKDVARDRGWTVVGNSTGVEVPSNYKEAMVDVVCSQGSHEGAFARRWHELTGHRLYVINLAAQGRSLDDLGSPTKTYLAKREFLLRKALEAIPSHYRTHFIGTLWVQGETADTDDYVGKYLALRERFQGIIDGYVDTTCRDSFISPFWYIGGLGGRNLAAQYTMCTSDEYPDVHSLSDAGHFMVSAEDNLNTAEDLRVGNGHTSAEGRRFLGRVWAEEVYGYRHRMGLI